MRGEIAKNNLIRRAALLKGVIIEAQSRILKARKDLRTVEGMLLLMDDGIRLGDIKGIRKHGKLPDFKHGELTRLCLEALRTAAHPITCPAMADYLAAEKGIKRTAPLVLRVRAVMVRLTREGRVVRGGVHRRRVWTLAGKTEPTTRTKI
jgi:hypothetical protein